MDGIEVLLYKSKMCEQYRNCKNCPIEKSGIDCNHVKTNEQANKMIGFICDYAAKHPLETKQDALLKIFPNSELDENSIVTLCPHKVDTNFECCGTCSSCREPYWKSLY